MTERSARATAVGYAWWLTGDPVTARQVVDRALATRAVRAAEPDDRLHALLATVRQAASTGITLSPPSEVALLHDRHGVPLRIAGALAAVSAADVSWALARGRLEALAKLPPQFPAHPERLGGLAVEDPVDVAHARHCASCGAFRDLLGRGRDEIIALPGPPAQPTTPTVGWSIPGLALGAAAAAGVLAAVAPSAALGMVGLGAVVGVVATRPAWAAYILLAVTPLVAGMDRGAVIPTLRPHEALVAVLGAGLVAHGIGRILTGRPIRVRVTGVHVALVALAIASSVLPLLWLVARGEAVTSDDLLHAIVLWKYLALFLLVRAAVRTEGQVARCLWVAMGASAAVAIVAVLQSLQWFGVHELLATYHAPFGDERALTINRGTSTLASSIAVGALMSYTLGISLGWLLRGARHRATLLALSVVFVLGALASGQFSGVIALLLAVAAVGWITGQLRRAAVAAVPAAAVGALLLRPVIERRLSGFDSPGGIPGSWSGRLENLRTFFWPELFTDGNFVLGVRPSARIPATESWRDWVWIESGHTWLLWAGGIPLFVAFFVFLWAALRAVARVARNRADAIGVAATASFASLWVMAGLMTLDVHLTIRGSADLLFPLLALALTANRGPRDARTAADARTESAAPANPVAAAAR